MLHHFYVLVVIPLQESFNRHIYDSYMYASKQTSQARVRTCSKVQFLINLVCYIIIIIGQECQNPRKRFVSCCLAPGVRMYLNFVRYILYQLSIYSLSVVKTFKKSFELIIGCVFTSFRSVLPMFKSPFIV